MISILELHTDFELLVDEVESGEILPEERDIYFNLAQDSIFNRLVDYEIGDLSAIEKRLGFDQPGRRGKFLSPFYREFNADTVPSNFASGLNHITYDDLFVDGRGIVKVTDFKIMYPSCENYNNARYMAPEVVSRASGSSLIAPSYLDPAWHYTDVGIKFFPKEELAGQVNPSPAIEAIGYVQPTKVDSESNPPIDSEFVYELKEYLLYEAIKHAGTNKREPALMELARAAKHG